MVRSAGLHGELNDGSAIAEGRQAPLLSWAIDLGGGRERWSGLMVLSEVMVNSGQKVCGDLDSRLGRYWYTLRMGKKLAF